MDVIRSLTSAIKQIVTRGSLLTSTLYPRRTMISCTGLAGEVFQNIELCLPYGMSAMPTAGDLVLLANMSYRSGVIALICQDGSLTIPDLALTEFGFRDVNQQQIVFRKDRIEITTPLKVVVTAPEVDITAPNTNIMGNVNIQGNLNVTGSITATQQITSTLGGTHTLTEHIHGTGPTPID